MKYSEEKLAQLLEAISILYNDPDCKDFAAGLRDLSGNYPDNPPLLKSIQIDKLDEVYELCIKRGMSRRAEGFYKSFSIFEIKDSLIELYYKMETARFNSDFELYCLYCFKQIEKIDNYLITNYSMIEDLSENLFNKPPLSFFSYSNRVCTRKKSGNNKTTKDFLFINNENNEEKSMSDFSIMEKFRTVLYFVGYDGFLSDWEFWKKQTDIASSLYEFRCIAAHEESLVNSKYKQTLIDNVNRNREIHYMVFESMLLWFTTLISNHYKHSSIIIAKVKKILPGIAFVSANGKDYQIQINKLPKEAKDGDEVILKIGESNDFDVFSYEILID